MNCPACSGEVSLIKHRMIDGDLMGTCKKCGGAYLSVHRHALATIWCSCKDTSNQEIYFWSDNNHGWLHTVCGQITQAG